jgi:two-component system phosphate regulon sensor histidine kinase PhoR
VLKRRLLVSYLLLTLVCTVATGLLVREGVERSRLADEVAVLSGATEAITRELAPVRAAGGEARVQELLALLGRASLLRLTLVAPDGRVVAETERDPAHVANHLDRPEIRAAAATGTGHAVRRSGTTAREYLYFARRTEDGAFLRAAVPLDRLALQLEHVNEVVLLGFGIELLFAAGLGWLVGSRLLRRIDNKLGAAERIAGGDLAARVAVDGDDELSALGRAMNRVADRLAAQIRELEERRKEISDVLDAVSDGLVSINAEDAVTHVNPEAARLFEAGRDAIGRPFWETVRDARLPEVVQRVRRELRPVELELAIGGPGPRRELEARVSPIHDAQGRYAGAVLAFRDVTRLNKLESVRRDFVANVSHEMKTPLTSVLGSVETLRDGALDDREAAQEFLAKIDRNARNLAHLVSDLLELSRIEAGGVRFSGEPVQVRDVVEESVAATADKAREKGVTLTLRADGDGLAVRGDPDLLVRAIVNLLENAVAYTPRGGRVEVAARAADGRVEIAVEDTGIGIPAAELDRIFERFYRVDKARSRALGGTGLGLAIVRHVAERHGGHVRVVSAEGRGSTFTLALPPYEAA